MERWVRQHNGLVIEPPASRGGVTVVVPTYNEAGNLERLVAAVSSHGYRMLIVDDSSPDGTGEIADGLAEASPLVAVLHRAAKQGLGPAYAAGFEVAIEAGAEIVCEMDADFSHDPRELPRLVEAVAAGADLAIGSRFVAGGAIVDWPAWRRGLSRMGNRYSRVMLSLPVNDATSGFRAFRREALLQLDPANCTAAGYGFQVEMAWRATRAGLRVVEVPITFRERQWGQSKLDGRIVLEAMWLVTRWGIGRWFGRGPGA